MLMADDVKVRTKMSDQLREALRGAGVDPAYALVLKVPEATDHSPVFHLFAAPDRPIETNLRKTIASGTDILMPKDQQILFLKFPDERAAICRQIGSTWVWI